MFKHPQRSEATPLNQKQKTAVQAEPLPTLHRHADGLQLEGIASVAISAIRCCFMANCIVFMVFDRLANSCVSELSEGAKDKAGLVAGS